MGALRSGRGRWLVAALIGIALVLAIAPGPNRAVAQDAASVDIVNFAYGPNSVTITAGGTVTWTNSDSVPHTAAGTGASFDTGTIDTGGSASITFDTPGTYSYFCTIHPEMTGTVVVLAAGGGDGGDEGEAVDQGDGVTGLPDTGAGRISTGESPALAMLAVAVALGALMLRRRYI